MRICRCETTEARPCDDSGVVLVILALICLALLLLAGLALDTSALKTAKKEQILLSDSVASVAMSAYSASAAPGPLERLEEARNSAEALAKLNVNASFTKSFLKNPAAQQDLGPKQAGGAFIPGPSGQGESGNIVPGKWHYVPTWLAPDFDKTTGACIGARPCPCDDNGKWAGPCFQPLNLDVPSTPPVSVNAFRADLHLRQDSPLRTTFMKAVGQEYLNVFSSSVVATRPMRIIYLVDLSRRSHSETHLPYEVVGAGVTAKFTAAESAYRLTNKTCAGAETYGFPGSSATCPHITLPCSSGTNFPTTDCQFAGGWFDGLNTASYNYHCGSTPFLPSPARVVASHGSRLRLRTEYRCVTVNYEEAGVAKPAAPYMVDIYRGGTKDVTPFIGAQPLGDMLNAVSLGLDRMKRRNVRDDFAAIIGFDQNADINVRKFPQEAPGTTEFSTMASPGTTEYDDMADFTSDAADPLLRYRDHFFFPREDALASFPAALHAAARMLLSRSDYSAADNHIVLITNGFSNCYDDTNGDHVCGRWDDQVSERTSINKAIEFAQKELAPKKIHLSVLMFSEMVKPHELKKRGTLSTNSGRCMRENEAAEQGLAYTNPGPEPAEPFNPADPSYTSHVDSALNPSQNSSATPKGVDPNTGAVTYRAFHTYPNKLYSAVSSTQGVWGPVRKPCAPESEQLAGGKSCADGGLDDYLDAKCGGLATGNATLGELFGSGSYSPITDADGRLVCDSRCRDRRTQLRDYIDQIFDRNPLAKVDDGVKVN